jgi:hypothetical protein
MTMHRILLAAAVAATTFTLVSPAEAQDRHRERDDRAFEWKGRVAEGDWLRIRNLNGEIRVEETSGSEVEVRAAKSWRRGDPDEVRFEVARSGNDVTICALWGDDTTCEGAGEVRGRQRSQNNDTAVEFTVRLPRGVRVATRTVNGAIRVDRASAEVIARTVNGGITANTLRGPVSAHTVNGSIRVRMESLAGSGDLSYGTVNGSVHLELPSTLGAELDVSTVNGSIRTDYPVTVSGEISRRRLQGRIGNGGRQLRLKTVNGSVEIRKLG